MWRLAQLQAPKARLLPYNRSCVGFRSGLGYIHLNAVCPNTFFKLKLEKYTCDLGTAHGFEMFVTSVVFKLPLPAFSHTRQIPCAHKLKLVSISIHLPIYKK